MISDEKIDTYKIQKISKVIGSFIECKKGSYTCMQPLLTSNIFDNEFEISKANRKEFQI